MLSKSFSDTLALSIPYSQDGTVVNYPSRLTSLSKALQSSSCLNSASHQKAINYNSVAPWYVSSQ